MGGLPRLHQKLVAMKANGGQVEHVRMMPTLTIFPQSSFHQQLQMHRQSGLKSTISW